MYHPLSVWYTLNGLPKRPGLRKNPRDHQEAQRKRVRDGEDEQGSKADIRRQADVAQRSLRGRRPVGQVVKTAASHAANRSSTLLRVISAQRCCVKYEF